MDTTDCLALPFPECEPPLVKDASDIAQFKALADATDAAVAAYALAVSTTLTAPPMVLMQGTQAIAGTDVTHYFNQPVIFDTAAMADTSADVIRIPEDGWYMLGWSYKSSNVASNFMRSEPLLNGDPFSSRQGPTSYISGVTNGEFGTFADVGFFREGDVVNFMTHHTGNPVTVFTYDVFMWALQVFANV